MDAPFLGPGAAIRRTADVQIHPTALLGRPDHVKPAIPRQNQARVFIFLGAAADPHRGRQYRIGNRPSIENNLRLGLRQMQQLR